jgi:hypothetical protein
MILNATVNQVDADPARPEGDGASGCVSGVELPARAGIGAMTKPGMFRPE